MSRSRPGSTPSWVRTCTRWEPERESSTVGGTRKGSSRAGSDRRPREVRPMWVTVESTFGPAQPALGTRTCPSTRPDPRGHRSLSTIRTSRGRCLYHVPCTDPETEEGRRRRLLSTSSLGETPSTPCTVTGGDPSFRRERFQWGLRPSSPFPSSFLPFLFFFVCFSTGLSVVSRCFRL